MAIAVLADLVQLVFELYDFLFDFAAVNLKLGFAGSSKTHATHRTSSTSSAACLPGKMRPGTGQPGEPVAILRQLHLQHPLTCAGMLRENIQNQRRPIDDLLSMPQFFFKFPLVPGRKLFIKKDDFSVQLICHQLDFLKFAAANIGSRVGVWQVLRDLPHHLEPGGFCQQLKFPQGIIKRETRICFGPELHPNHQGCFGCSFSIYRFVCCVFIDGFQPIP